MPKIQGHRDNLGFGLKKGHRGFLAAVRPLVLHVTFALAHCFRRTLPGQSNYLDRGACDIWVPSTSPYTCTSTQSRGLSFLSRTKNAEDNGDNFERCNLGHRISRCTHSPSWLPMSSHPPVMAGHTSRTMGNATGFVPFRVTQTGAVESITGSSVTITRNWLKEGGRDVGCCGRIASRENRPIFQVAGAVECTV